jgi:hypothetical protein
VRESFAARIFLRSGKVGIIVVVEMEYVQKAIGKGSHELVVIDP